MENRPNKADCLTRLAVGLLGVGTLAAGVVATFTPTLSETVNGPIETKVAGIALMGIGIICGLFSFNG